MTRKLLWVPMALLMGCAGYDISVNKRIVYSIPTSLDGLSVEDKQLHSCIEVSIKSEKISKIEQLDTLYCTDQQIRTLNGIETLPKLVRLGLASNLLTDISAANKLIELRHVELSNNKLTSVKALTLLPKLESVNLKGNKELKCEELELFNPAVVVQAPKHCL